MARLAASFLSAKMRGWHDALQTEYLAKEDPRALWVALADHFDHQKDIFLPEARHVEKW